MFCKSLLANFIRSVLKFRLSGFDSLLIVLNIRSVFLNEFVICLNEREVGHYVLICFIQLITSVTKVIAEIRNCTSNNPSFISPQKIIIPNEEISPDTICIATEVFSNLGNIFILSGLLTSYGTKLVSDILVFCDRILLNDFNFISIISNDRSVYLNIRYDNFDILFCIRYSLSCGFKTCLKFIQTFFGICRAMTRTIEICVGPLRFIYPQEIIIPYSIGENGNAIKKRINFMLLTLLFGIKPIESAGYGLMFFFELIVLFGKLFMLFAEILMFLTEIIKSLIDNL